MLTRWIQFTRERFDPLSHLTMIAVFFLAHWVVQGAISGEARGLMTEWFRVLCLAAGTVVFFFKLRVYDELKDYELDLKINPSRPLARGLVKHSEMHRAIVVCIALELAFFAAAGFAGVVAMAMAIAYSLLMYKEFFIRDRIRPHLTTYAVSHTVISLFLSLAIFSALSGSYPWALGRPFFLFALNSWCLFNVFEFGRKTFATDEERPGVESYSRIFGRPGAGLLTLTMALASTWLLELALGTRGRTYLAIVDGLVLVSAAVYAVLNRPAAGKAFRALSSLYIVLVYAGLLFFFRGDLKW